MLEVYFNLKANHNSEFAFKTKSLALAANLDHLNLNLFIEQFNFIILLRFVRSMIDDYSI
jgi:hypothetical protein